MEKFSALWLDDQDGDTVATVNETTISQLPEHE